jgi:hypothetical protein
MSQNKLDFVQIAKGGTPLIWDPPITMDDGTILNGMKRVFNPFDLVPIGFGIGSVASRALRIR